MPESINPPVAIANYEVLARVPTQATIRLFQDFYYYDERPIRTAEGEPFWKYILHPKQLLLDLAQSGNKVWFLKNVFKLPLPYASMISIAKKCVDRE